MMLILNIFTVLIFLIDLFLSTKLLTKNIYLEGSQSIILIIIIDKFLLYIDI